MLMSNDIASEKQYTNHLFVHHHEEITIAFRRHFELNSEFVASYHEGRARGRSMDSAGLSTIRAMRSSDMMMGVAEGLIYSTQFVKETVHSFFENEGITLRQEQRERLNSLWDEDDGQRVSMFGDSNGNDYQRQSDTSASVVLQHATVGQRASTVNQEDRLINNIEMALVGGGGGNDGGFSSAEHSTVNVADESLMNALDTLHMHYDSSPEPQRSTSARM